MATSLRLTDTANLVGVSGHLRESSLRNRAVLSARKDTVLAAQPPCTAQASITIEWRS